MLPMLNDKGNYKRLGNVHRKINTNCILHHTLNRFSDSFWSHCIAGCDLPNYGENCSQVCECGPGVDRCDSISGCVCLSGWTGKSCDLDIDECQENPNVCGTQRICVNNEGSYRCVCGEGLQLVDITCEGVCFLSDAFPLKNLAHH